MKTTPNKKQKQLSFLKKQKSDYGGTLSTTRDNRQRARPLATRNTMHLVLRSSQAKGPLSFRKHQTEIKNILKKFSQKYHVKILAFANVGNHLHLHIKLYRREQYKKFIRAITAAIMMRVTGINRWTKNATKLTGRFWDLRPFTRILSSYTERLYIKDYIAINNYQNLGYTKLEARFIYNWQKAKPG